MRNKYEMYQNKKNWYTKAVLKKPFMAVISSLELKPCLNLNQVGSGLIHKDINAPFSCSFASGIGPVLSGGMGWSGALITPLPSAIHFTDQSIGNCRFYVLISIIVSAHNRDRTNRVKMHNKDNLETGILCFLLARLTSLVKVCSSK